MECAGIDTYEDDCLERLGDLLEEHLAEDRFEEYRVYEDDDEFFYKLHWGHFCCSACGYEEAKVLESEYEGYLDNELVACINCGKEHQMYDGRHLNNHIKTRIYEQTRHNLDGSVT
ncbi:MAG: hypothetical protein ACFB0B_15430 [Thermonemataceae bacterium]